MESVCEDTERLRAEQKSTYHSFIKILDPDEVPQAQWELTGYSLIFQNQITTWVLKLWEKYDELIQISAPNIQYMESHSELV